MDLAERHAAPDGVAPRLTDDEASKMMIHVPGWVCADDRLARDLKVKDFRAALKLVNDVGELAEEQNHHPDLLIHGWNKVRIEFYTHTAKGLSENDFILAAKINRLLPT